VSDDNRELVAQITTYLAGHPHACDTAAGVHQWWLAGTTATIPEVSAALDRLVAIGRMERVQQPSGVVFRASASKNTRA
jgi:hypothetical protein